MVFFKTLLLAAFAACVFCAEDVAEAVSEEFEEYGAHEDMTIDQIIAAAGTAEGAAVAAGKNREINYDMDMNMEPLQYEMTYGNMQGFAGAGLSNAYYRWPKGIIPYQISGRYSSSQMSAIYAGMQMWMDKTCIRFVKRGSAEARSTGHDHYINIISGGGCYSNVGYLHRPHDVSLQARGCTIPGIAAHEFGHTIGLHHEQCRQDRDGYLKIFLNNVPRNMQSNFNKQPGTTNFGMKYDYCSLMHYGATAFGGGKFTMVPKDLDYLGTIGRSHVAGAGLSYTDATIVNTMYGCPNRVAQTACPKVPCRSKYSSSTCASLQSKLG